MCCGMVSWNRNVDAQRCLYRLRSGPEFAEQDESGSRRQRESAVDPATRVPYFPTMCETSFSFSLQMYSISSVPVTNCQVNFTVQGLV